MARTFPRGPYRPNVARDTRLEQATGGLAESPSDADLGIGEDDAPDDPMEALLSNPALQALVDVAVQRRLGELGATAPPQSSDGMAALLKGFERLMDIQAQQQPGYMKPLPAGEVERRAKGFVDMKAFTDAAIDAKEEMRYRLVDQPLYAGEIEYRPGSEIVVTRKDFYPNEYMAPLTDAARRVHAAYMQWIGGPSMGIAERVEEAERERRQRAPAGILDPSPFRRAGLPEESPVTVVADPQEDRRFDPAAHPAAHQVVNTAFPV